MIPGFHTLSAAWLFLLVIPLVVFYFLKLKRPRLEIPSLVLWRQVLNDNRVNSPFQRFKRNLLLILQLLLLLLLILAAMQPFLRRRAERAYRLPVLIDCSASMAALDKPGGVTRLDAAKAKVREMIEGMLADQQICLISFSKAARKRTGFTNNKRELLDALNAIEIENVPGDVEDALRLAQALARSEAFDDVYVFSDGNFPARVNFELSFNVRFQKLPPAAPNFGITSFNARRSVAGRWDVFVQVEGSGAAEGSATVELLQEGESIGRERVSLGKGGSQRLIFGVRGDKPVGLEARLEPDGFDSLAADNTAFLPLPAARELTVYCAPKLSAFRHALGALKDVTVTETVPAGRVDLMITDRAEDQAVAGTTRCYVGMVPAALSNLVTIVDQPSQPVDWKRDASLLQHVELADVIVLDEPRAAPNATEAELANLNFEILVHGRRGPLMLEQRGEETHAIYFLFRPDRSTLPYRVGFPILVANLAQLAMREAGISEAQAEPGRSLLAASETRLASVDQLEFNEQLKVAAATEPLKQDRPLWQAMIWGALALLLVEWWFFQRRPGGWK